MARRKRTFGELLRLERRGKRLTGSEKRRLRSLKGALTRSRRAYSLSDLQEYVFSTLSEVEQYRLHQFWGREGARVTNQKKRAEKERIRREKAKQKKNWRSDFKEILQCLRKLQRELKVETGFKWNIEQTATSQFAELRCVKGWAPPGVMTDCMDRVDPSPLRVVPNMIVMVLCRIEQEPDFVLRPGDQRKVVTITIENEKRKFSEEWKFVAFALRGDVAWSQTAGALFGVESRYVVDQIVAISITWLEETQADLAAEERARKRGQVWR